jgi:hypothetical protein
MLNSKKKSLFSIKGNFLFPQNLLFPLLILLRLLLLMIMQIYGWLFAIHSCEYLYVYISAAIFHRLLLCISVLKLNFYLHFSLRVHLQIDWYKIYLTHTLSHSLSHSRTRTYKVHNYCQRDLKILKNKYLIGSIGLFWMYLCTNILSISLTDDAIRSVKSQISNFHIKFIHESSHNMYDLTMKWWEKI